jgi:hypothetical protein
LFCVELGVGDGDGEGDGEGAGDSPGAGCGSRGSGRVSSGAGSLNAARAVVAGMTLKRNQVSFSPSAVRVAHPPTLIVLSEPTIFRPSKATRPETPLCTITSFFSFPKEPKLFASFVLRLAHVIFRLHR